MYVFFSENAQCFVRAFFKIFSGSPKIRFEYLQTSRVLFLVEFSFFLMFFYFKYMTNLDFRVHVNCFLKMPKTHNADSILTGAKSL